MCKKKKTLEWVIRLPLLIADTFDNIKICRSRNKKKTKKTKLNKEYKKTNDDDDDDDDIDDKENEIKF